MNTTDSPLWGTLTGIRPVKRVVKLLELGKSDAEVRESLRTEFGVSEGKINIALAIAKKEREVVKTIRPGSISLYVDIPFCPSRCVYCSFASMGMDKMGRYMQPYLDALFEEIGETARIVQEMGLLIETVYIGGGTPTTLLSLEMKNLLRKLVQSFDLSGVREFCVEAGRPDTITKDKLSVMREYGVDRISINPQSMNQKTLDLIGRKHTVEQIETTYRLAREFGFGAINMDVIAGLPGETTADFRHTLDRVAALEPENITVHTMSVKRAARLNAQEAALPAPDGGAVDEMMGYAYEKMSLCGYEPYYLYRQKNVKAVLGNQENTGFCKPGFEGLYNICMMEEIQSVVAMGVGGVSKLVRGDRIERIFNFKDVIEYINRIEEIKARKQYIREFLTAEELSL